MALTATYATHELQRTLNARGIGADWDQAWILRRSQMTLRRWYEQECGDGYTLIERDENTGIPYAYNYNHSYLDPHDPRARRQIPDREKAAQKRIQTVCATLGIYYYIQSDPRGCALYVSTEPLTDSNYTNGVACCD